MERRLSSRDVTFDPTPESEDDEHSSFSPASYLPASNADPAEQIESAEWEDSTSSRLGAALSELDARSQAIVRRRWLADDKATLHDLADEYGVSAERVRQIEAAALKKLKVAMA